MGLIYSIGLTRKTPRIDLLANQFGGIGGMGLIYNFRKTCKPSRIDFVAQINSWGLIACGLFFWGGAVQKRMCAILCGRTKKGEPQFRFATKTVFLMLFSKSLTNLRFVQISEFA